MIEKPTKHLITMTQHNALAIIEGRKTQTRRALRHQPPKVIIESHTHRSIKTSKGDQLHWIHAALPRQVCPYGEPGHELWIQEPYRVVQRCDDYAYVRYLCDGQVIQRHIPKTHLSKPSSNVRQSYLPGRFMPWWAVRTKRIVTAVKAERLKDISGFDAEAEGIKLDFPGGHHGAYKRARRAFFKLWDSINKRRGYSTAVNPWVWAIAFKQKDS